MIQCRLLGKNIQRSQSPAFHNELANKLKVPLHYALEELTFEDSESLCQYTQQLFDSSIDAANVTYPYKEQILNVADHLDTSAARVGAANTLVKREGKIIAFNTDYSGFIAAYRQFSRRPPGNVVVVGCGGVGKAICFALAELGASQIAIYDREPKKMQALAEQLTAQTIPVQCLTSDKLKQYVLAADGVLNCTPIGHYQTPGCPIDPGWLDDQHWVFDAVYTPRETELIQAAERQDIRCLGGFELFFHQANDAFTLFTGLTAPTHQLAALKQSQIDHLR